MPDLTGVKNAPLKMIFVGHLFLISLSTMGYWAPPAYVLYNSVLLLILIWALHSCESEEPIELAFVINGSAIILDIFILAFCFPESHSANRFSAAIAILHLIVRPFSTIYLMQILRERKGNIGLINNMFPAARNQSYEDIDRTAAAGPPAGRDFDFSTAQQI